LLEQKKDLVCTIR